MSNELRAAIDYRPGKARAGIGTCTGIKVNGRACTRQGRYACCVCQTVWCGNHSPVRQYGREVSVWHPEAKVYVVTRLTDPKNICSRCWKGLGQQRRIGEASR